MILSVECDFSYDSELVTQIFIDPPGVVGILEVDEKRYLNSGS